MNVIRCNFKSSVERPRPFRHQVNETCTAIFGATLTCLRPLFQHVFFANALFVGVTNTTVLSAGLSHMFIGMTVAQIVTTWSTGYHGFLQNMSLEGMPSLLYISQTLAPMLIEKGYTDEEVVATLIATCTGVNIVAGILQIMSSRIKSFQKVSEIIPFEAQEMLNVTIALGTASQHVEPCECCYIRLVLNNRLDPRPPFSWNMYGVLYMRSLPNMLCVNLEFLRFRWNQMRCAWCMVFMACPAIYDTLLKVYVQHKTSAHDVACRLLTQWCVHILCDIRVLPVP